MKYAYLADTHMRGPDLDVATRQLSSAVDVILDRRIEHVIFCGDQFDKNTVHDRHGSTGEIVAAFASEIKRMPNVYMVDGDHDKPNPRIETSANLSVAHLDNVRLFQEPDCMVIGDTAFCFVPWMYDVPAIEAITDAHDKATWLQCEKMVLVGHMSVMGGVGSGGHVIERGHFCISPKELEGFGFDHIALGDFHRRQKYYVGALRQLNHGEEGNPQGFEIWDSETGEAEWIELDEAPKYKTIEWAKGDPRPEVIPNGTITKVRTIGWIPEDPGDLTIDAVIERKVQDRRADIPDGILSDKHAVLGIWEKANDAEDESLHAALIEAMNGIGASEDGLTRGEGTLRILSTTIEGFGPHDHFHIDWTDYDSLVAILAPNGSGKSFLLEADFACLFGEFPSYPGSLYDCMTQGGSGEARLETVFEINGQNYTAIRALRDTGKTKSHEAKLIRDGHEYSEAIAGPKVRDFESYIETLLGSKQTALASWFSGQGGSGDICLLSAADRRRVFGELLGMESLDRIADKAKEIADKESGILHSAETRLEDLEDPTAEIEEATFSVERAREEKGGAEQSLEEAKLLLKQAEKDLSARRQDRAVAVEKLENAPDLDQLEKDLLSVKQSLGHAKHAEEQIPAMTGKRMQAEALKKKRTKALAWEKYLQDRERIESQIAAKNEIIESHSVSAADREKAKLLPDMEEGLKEANDQLESSRKRFTEIAGKIAGIQARIPEDASEPEAPFGEDCAPCALYKQALYEHSKRGDMLEQLAKLQREKEELEKAGKHLRERTDELAEKVQEARAAAGRVADSGRKSASAKESLEILNLELSALDAPEEAHESSQDLTTRIDQLEAETKDLPALEERARQIGQLTERRDSLQAQYDKWADAELPDLEAIDAEITELQQAVNKHSGNVDGIQEYLTEYTQEITRLESKLESLWERDKEITRLTEEADKARTRVETFKTLRTAFSPRGVQALILDSAMADLEEVAHNIIHDATDGRRGIEIRTQVENADGSMREDLAIFAIDEYGRRDVSRFSGGNKAMIQIVMRIAMTRWISRLTGRKAGEIRIDEAFDALDTERAITVIDMLQRLDHHFERVVLVTHNPAFASRIPDRIELGVSV